MKMSLLIIPFVFAMVGCTNNSPKTSGGDTAAPSPNIKLKPSIPRNISHQFKEYWYAGKAEISSYQLRQERYGEMREGTVVNIFVTEDFLTEEQVKAQEPSDNTISVMKLNQTKKFNTGIYPYSIMTSTFSPIAQQAHAIKVSNSIQEWCGQVYMQLNNRQGFDIQSHSYFEGEADQTLSLPKTWLENELWNLIRINPEELPTGDIKLIPSFEYLRMQHKKTKEYHAFASLKQRDSITIYTINYPNLQRQLTFFFKSRFPYEIEKWEEVNAAFQSDSSRLHTTATLKKRMKTDYWNQNKNEFLRLRDSLQLH